jgi:hypothetical protein
MYWEEPYNVDGPSKSKVPSKFRAKNNPLRQLSTEVANADQEEIVFQDCEEDMMADEENVAEGVLREQGDVPMHTSDHASSLPSVEEVRGKGWSAGLSTAQLGFVLFLFVGSVLTIGLSVGLTQKPKNDAPLSESNADAGWDIDPAKVRPRDDDFISSTTNFTNDIDNEVIDAPSEPKEDASLEEVVDYLVKTGVTPSSAFENRFSPQAKAALWLAEIDEMMMEIPDSEDLAETEPYEFVERYVLAVFYYAMNGPEWKQSFGFMTGRDICQWNDPVIVDDPSSSSAMETLPGGVYCDGASTSQWHASEKREITSLFLGTSIGNTSPLCRRVLPFISHLRLFCLFQMPTT